MGIAVTGNACKAAYVQPKQGVFYLDECAKTLQDASEADQEFRYHVLVWYNQQPKWMKELDGTDTYENLYDTWDGILKDHIEGVMSGIKQAAGVDHIYAYDVVNEAIEY